MPIGVLSSYIYAIRLAGHQSPRHGCAGWDRRGIAVYSLWLISWLFADNLQISCDSLGGFEEKSVTLAASYIN